MEEIFTNPGLIHIAEHILLYLDTKSLLSCEIAHPSWRKVVKNPWLWLKRCSTLPLMAQISMSQNNIFVKILDRHQSWMSLIKATYGTSLEKNVKSLLMKIYEDFMGSQKVPSLLSPTPLHSASRFGDLELIQLLLHQLMDQSMIRDQFNSSITYELPKEYSKPNYRSCNVIWKFQGTPLHLASLHGHSDVVIFMLEHLDQSIIKDQFSRELPSQITFSKDTSEKIVCLNPVDLAAFKIHCYFQ